MPVVIGNHYRVLWRSPSIPREPFVYRNTLCKALKQRISDAFLQVHKHPELQVWLDRLNAEKIVSITDSNYDIVRKLQLQ